MIPLFSFLPELSKNHCSICFVPLAPFSMMKHAVLPAMFSIANCRTRAFTKMSPFFAKGTRSSGFSTQMESAQEPEGQKACLRDLAGVVTVILTPRSDLVYKFYFPF